MNFDEKYFQALEVWKKNVADTYDGYAKNPSFDLDLDFYAFQSSVRFSPPLLIIGANPGGDCSYSEKNKKEERDRRTQHDLGYTENQYLENPNWPSSSICDVFSGEKLRPMFENAVITNLAYFNTPKFNFLKRRRGARVAIEFSKNANKDLIDILNPKNIILMGNIALSGMSKFFDTPIAPLLTTLDGRSALIRTTSISGINTFWIHHPSMNKKFNTGENLKLKTQKLEEILMV